MPAVFSLAKFRQKFFKKKEKKRNDFEGFQSLAKSDQEKKKTKIRHIHIYVYIYLVLIV
jgi:hypothetical protein